MRSRIATKKDEHANIIEKSVETETHSHVDSKNGEYLTFRKIWEKEGLDEEGYKGAVSYIAKCAVMRGPWCHFDGMAENWKFLYVTYGVANQGLDEQANKDAMNYIAKCANTRDPWCKFDGENVKFLYVCPRG